jgi:hypothetical protein
MLAREAANRSRRVFPTTWMLKLLALRLLMLGSSSGGAGRAVGVGFDGVALVVSPLGEGALTFETLRRRSSTASTTPTAPTIRAVAVAVPAIATRVVLPTSVTVPTPRKHE